MPNWLKNLSSQENYFVFKNIENKVNNSKKILLSRELLPDLDFLNEENLYYFQTLTPNGYITTIVDVSIKKFAKSDIYLLNDKKNYFLANIELSKFSKDKLSVKPYFNNFSPFQINLNQLDISGKILWQCSKILTK